VLAWCVAVASAFSTRLEAPGLAGMIKLVGGVLFVLGSSLFVWSLLHLREGFLGNVEPETEHLATRGPYRFMRHPLYLGMITTTVGLTIGIRSAWGTLAVFVLFVPATVYRARLEERALMARFGEEWNEYARRTSFMFPPVW